MFDNEGNKIWAYGQGHDASFELRHVSKVDRGWDILKNSYDRHSFVSSEQHSPNDWKRPFMIKKM